jgi:hypothetical protein
VIRSCNCGCRGPALGRYAYPPREERLRSLEQYASELERQRAEVAEEMNRLKNETA